MSKIANLNKSQQLLYALIKLNGGIDDKVVLAKLQYFADFIHFAFNNEPISEESIVYTRQDHGPLARDLTDNLGLLKDHKLISESKQYNYKASKDIDLQLTSDQIRTIKYVLSKYGKSSWKDLRAISHEQVPYLSAEQGGVVDFFTAYNLIDDYPDYASFNTSLS